MIVIERKKLNSKGLSEIYQRRWFKMCLLDDENNPITKLVKCKDYFNDVIWSIINQNPIDIYGFEFDGTDFSIENFKFKLYVDLNKENNEEEITNLMFTLNNYYKEYNINVTIAKEGYIVEIPRQIFEISGALSWFLFVIRNQDIDSLKEKEEVDFIKQIRARADGSDFEIADRLLHLIKNKGYDKFKESLTMKPISSFLISEIHNNSGILAMLESVK